MFNICLKLRLDDNGSLMCFNAVYLFAYLLVCSNMNYLVTIDKYYIVSLQLIR